MLITNFYHIKDKRTGTGEAHYKVVFPSNCDVYRGHFPSEPVSPGVCTIQMIKELTEEAVGRALTISNISNCKLTHVLVPSDEKTINADITFSDTGDNVTINAIVWEGETTYIKMRATLS